MTDDDCLSTWNNLAVRRGGVIAPVPLVPQALVEVLHMLMAVSHVPKRWHLACSHIWECQLFCGSLPNNATKNGLQNWVDLFQALDSLCLQKFKGLCICKKKSNFSH